MKGIKKYLTNVRAQSKRCCSKELAGTESLRLTSGKDLTGIAIADSLEPVETAV